MNFTFGRNPITNDDGDSEVDLVIRETEDLGAVGNRIVMSEAYDLTYGLFDHNNNSIKDGLSIVAHHKQESFIDNSPLYDAMRRYKQLRINSHFNISLLEYLSLPTYVVRMLSDLAEEFELDAKDRVENVEEELEKLKSGF